MKSVTQDDIEEFIRENCPVGDWDTSENVTGWVRWMLAHGCLDVFTEDGTSISALLCSRMSNEEHMEEDFHIDPEGECLVIDMLLSRKKNSPLFLNSIGHFLINKHGQPETVYWPRGEDRHKEKAESLSRLLGLPTQ